MKQANVMQ
jgi:chaperonin cofactor prefoldin